MKQVNLRINQKILSLLVGLFLCVGAYAQTVTVKGHVVDATGLEVIGANVVEKGNTTNGTITDFEGNFTLTVPQGATLQISFIGYKPVEVAAAPTVNVTMEDDTELLGEVVVIGYGVARKNDLTGSVTAVKPDEMNRGLVTNASDMMQGKIAGVNVQNNGGAPGGGATIRIRGGSSLNASNDPLIVIDGLAMDSYGVEGLSNPLSMVNPNDIESFTVLKDASATAIYGSRASNGVILITTKKGRKDSKPRISYNGNVSFSKVKSTVDVMNGQEFGEFVEDVWGVGSDQWNLVTKQTDANGNYLMDANGNYLYANTDWQDAIYRTGVSTDHNLTISGGLNNMPYRASIGYTSQEGVLKTSDFERITASFNIAPSFFEDHLSVNLNAKGMYSRTNYADEGAIGQAVSMDPTKPIYDHSDFGMANYGGYWQWPYASDYDPVWQNGVNNLAVANPMATLMLHSNEGKSKVLMGNLELDYKVHGLEDLRLHVNGGMNLSSGDTDEVHSPYFYDTDIYYYGKNRWASKDTYNLSLNAYAQYMKDFTEDHHFDIMAGYEWQHFHIETDYYECGYYRDTHLNFPGQEYDAPTSTTLYKSENYLVSFFGRLNYSYKNRYLLTATVRGDGSSRFSSGNRWGVFPSVALAWRLKEEAFLKDVDVLSDFKLRLGYGITGQQEGIGDYTYFASYMPNKSGAYYPVVGEGITYRPDAYNTDLTWEKTTTYNAGIDLSFWDNRLTANIDYYYRKTTDLINTVYIAAGSNFSNRLTSNIGSLHNQGVELALTWRPIQTEDWNWELGYNVTWNSNEIDELVASQGDDYVVQYGGSAVGAGGTDGIKAYAVGHPSSVFYTYQQVYDKNGQPIQGEYVDRDGNGIINGDDRYFYKKADPDVLMGLTSKLIYKNWDFNFSLRASIGNYNYNAVEVGNSNLSPSSINSGGTLKNVLDMTRAKNWQQVSNIDGLSDYFIQNASYLKCDNITLGYSFSDLGSTSISGRVYFTAQNIFTITKYKGLDPEVNGGYDGNIYPRPFVGIFGVSLNF